MIKLYKISYIDYNLSSKINRSGLLFYKISKKLSFFSVSWYNKIAYSKKTRNKMVNVYFYMLNL